MLKIELKQIDEERYLMCRTCLRISPIDGKIIAEGHYLQKHPFMILDTSNGKKKGVFVKVDSWRDIDPTLKNIALKFKLVGELLILKKSKHILCE